MLPFSQFSTSIVLPQYEPLPDGYNNIGELLKEYRTKNNLSLSEVARKLGVFSYNVRYWEKGGIPNFKNHRNILNFVENKSILLS